MTRKTILSIDGGSICGIIPICALIELDQLIGKPAREAFDHTPPGAYVPG